MRANGTRRIMIFYKVKPPIVEAAELKFIKVLRKQVSQDDIIILDLPWPSKENFLNPKDGDSRIKRIQMGLLVVLRILW